MFQQMSSQCRSQKLLQGLASHGFTAYFSIFNLVLIQWIMAILSKGCKPDNFEPYTSLDHSFTDIAGLGSNFIECESFFEATTGFISFFWC